MKILFLLVALVSSALHAQECKINVSARSVNAFYTKYEADKYCEQFAYSQINCAVSVKADRSWISQIDFNDVFAGADDSFQIARTEAYRNYFNWLDSKRIYLLPTTFKVSFNCKQY